MTREPLAPEFIAAARHLRQLADAAAMLTMSNPVTTAATGVAGRDLADRTFDDAWGDGTVELAAEVGPRVASVVDHLHSMSAVTLAPQTSFSLASLARPVLEGLGALYWLYDPTVDVRERVRRRYNLRLLSLAEQHILAETLSSAARDEVAQKIFAIKASARRLGFEFRPQGRARPGVPPLFSLDEPVPRDQRLISDVMNDGGGLERFGPLFHRLTSAVSHAQPHGLLPFILRTEASAEQHVASAQVGLTFAWYIKLTGGPVMALNTTMLRIAAYFGWDRETWDRAGQPAIVDWRDWLLKT